MIIQAEKKLLTYTYIHWGIFEQAFASTSEHLKSVGCPDNYTLILDSHHNVKKYVDVPIKAVILFSGIAISTFFSA